MIAERFRVPEASIDRYLSAWPTGLWDADEPPKAYESDEATQGDCWQMTYFMDKPGYPYEWE